MSAAELYAIAAAMRRAGAGGIASEAARALRAGEEPVHAAMVASVTAKLPHSGGLGAWVAEAKFSYRVRGGGDVVAAVRVGKAGHDLQDLDDGVVIHPDNSRRRRGWFSQEVPPGTISNPIREEGGNQLERAGVTAIDIAAAKIISA